VAAAAAMAVSRSSCAATAASSRPPVSPAHPFKIIIIGGEPGMKSADFS
jgi:hypothetical protein